MVHILNWLFFGNVPAPDFCCLLNNKWFQVRNKSVTVLPDGNNVIYGETCYCL